MIISLSIILEIEDTIATWVFSHFPTVATCLTLIILTFRFTWWARGRFIDYRDDYGNKISKVDDKITKVDYKITKVEDKISKIEADCSQLNNNQIVFNRNLNRIDKKLDHLIIHLQSTKKIDADLFKSQSPTELTDNGSRILEEMGGKCYVDTHLEKLIIQIEEQQFKSGLDVQNYCSILLTERFSEDDDLTSVKDYIYITPMYRISEDIVIPLDLTVAITIMGIYLRNKYFERHPD